MNILEKMQLYSLATPNGQKVSIALEEMNVPYEAYKIDITKGEQFSKEFIAINPNSKIPALIDPIGNDGKPLSIMESGAILLYLAEKTGKFLSRELGKKNQIIQWLFWQVGGLGPMLGQYGHFSVYAEGNQKIPYAIERYTKEAKRLLTVLETQLKNKRYIIGDELTIADFAIMPWIVCLDKYYNATEKLELKKFSYINQWVEELLARPAIQKGMNVCSIDESNN